MGYSLDVGSECYCERHVWSGRCDVDKWAAYLISGSSRLAVEEEELQLYVGSLWLTTNHNYDTSSTNQPEANSI